MGFIVGIDLSGPSNIKDTSLTLFEEKGGELLFVEGHSGLSDLQIYQVVSGLLESDNVFVGLDAPLSYNPGGGDRPGDKKLRQQVLAAGLPSGSVMVPTLTRMAYLTLRGIVIARLLRSLSWSGLYIVEAHPTAALALRGAPLSAVKSIKDKPSARKKLLAWLETQGLVNLSQLSTLTDHDIAASAAVLATWHWKLGKPYWIEPADPPLHPYDYVC